MGEVHWRYNWKTFRRSTPLCLQSSSQHEFTSLGRKAREARDLRGQACSRRRVHQRPSDLPRCK
ncbi:hypothetical protein AZE42_13855 [Rhizopogon vesiculosus]|uniref:Uncharacterized protein n=1 Tax=Rhizopogon vesiculosus TaxID=180088 RepID=A0A1J8QEV5_9AGAM|nr:hypothetical protein AZE42_13855 [Rhizopogon vesiculosus]